MKKTNDHTPKLTLNHETVRTLARKDLALIVGGMSNSTTGCDEPVNAYPTPWR